MNTIAIKDITTGTRLISPVTHLLAIADGPATQHGDGWRVPVRDRVPCDFIAADNATDTLLLATAETPTPEMREAQSPEGAEGEVRNAERSKTCLGLWRQCVRMTTGSDTPPRYSPRWTPNNAPAPVAWRLGACKKEKGI